MPHFIDRLTRFFGHDRSLSARARRARSRRPCVEILEQRLELSGVTGEWQGTLTETGQGVSPQFNLDMNLVQTQQSVHGTSHHTIGGDSQSYLNTTITGTVNQSTFSFADTAITSQVPPPGSSWLLISGTLQISTDGNSLTGNWVSGANHGGISLTKVSAFIQITNMAPGGIFYIGADTSMPVIAANLVGVTPDAGTSLTWTTEVDYLAANYPAIKGVRGQGRDMFVSYPSESTAGIQYRPSFKDASGEQIQSGGSVTITVTATIDGQKVSYQTNAEDDGAIEIEGTNPTPQAIHNYVASFTQPKSWPLQTQYNYHKLIRKIISHESMMIQFYQGEPLWSQDNNKGAGLMQLTNPAPSSLAVWDWQEQITDGIALFNNDKLQVAINRLKGQDLLNRQGQVVGHSPGLFDAIQKEASALNAKAAPISGDMIGLEAIRGFNGYNNGAGSFDEWEPVRDSIGKLVITNGLTSWERVPTATRTKGVALNKIKGDPNYVNNVLNAPDF